MNGYIAFYRGRRYELHADTSYKAQVLAAVYFKAKKPWEVTILLCEKDGQIVGQAI